MEELREFSPSYNNLFQPTSLGKDDSSIFGAEINEKGNHINSSDIFLPFFLSLSVFLQDSSEMGAQVLVIALRYSRGKNEGEGLCKCNQLL